MAADDLINASSTSVFSCSYKMTHQAAQALQAALAAAWTDAADSKDQVPLRSQKIAEMLSLLQASQQQAWFDNFLCEHVAATYPKQFR
jgi:hypothetical protein